MPERSRRRRARGTRGFLAPLAAAVLAAGGGWARPPEARGEPPGPEVGEIRIEREDVFDLDRRPWLFYRLVNAMNAVVREEVVRREVEAVLQPGQPASPALVAEAERNLRALPFLSEVEVTAAPIDERRQDVVVRTRDRLTFHAEASAGLFRGARKSRLALGETDLFGSGKSLDLEYESNPDRDALGLRYADPQLLGTGHRLEAGWSEASDGYEHSVTVAKLFQTLATTWSYGGSVRDRKQGALFFEDGEEVAEVPVQQRGATLDLARSFGPREELYRPGVHLSIREDRYGNAQGEQAGQVRVPEDGVVTTAGPTVRVELVPRFGKRVRMDSIDYVEDYPLGVLLDGFAGAERRDARDGPDRIELAASGSATGIAALGEEHLLSARAAAGLRAHDEPVGWQASGFLHYYCFGLPRQTVVASAGADAWWEREDLNLQLTLGEDNGLRGYSVRRFAGHRRVRFNLEDRIFTGLEVLSVHTGLVAFFDAGMAWDHGDPRPPTRLARSVGLGLRFGSARLLGGKVVRVDLARPLASVDGEALAWSLSASVGQVVSLLGHAEGLDRPTGFGF